MSGHINSHYVPQFILKKFSGKLCLYNVKTREYAEDVAVDHAYAIKDYYDEATEKKLNLKLESHFGNLLTNKLLKCQNTVELSRDELFLVKKFLLVSVLRSCDGEQFSAFEKKYYDILTKIINNRSDGESVTAEDLAPFQEKQIVGETSYQYWLRTINVILDTNGSPAEIMKHPDKTYPAHRWSEVINAGYLAFWDADTRHDEFIITDIGMTSENEKGWNGITNHNRLKMDCLSNLLQLEQDERMKTEIYKHMQFTVNFHENFQMFPISARRMIVLIAPFFKFRQAYKKWYSMPTLKQLTCLNNEFLYAPNDVKYILPQTSTSPVYHNDDKYVYQIKELTSAETRYCNELFLDRIDTYLGFSELGKIVGSLIKYKKDNTAPLVPRVDYTGLYKIIEERYGGTLHV